MLNIQPEKALAHDPETGTLWVDVSGTVAFLHRLHSEEGYQLTRLRDGKCLEFGYDKSKIVSGFCPLHCAVVIQNSRNSS